MSKGKEQLGMRKLRNSQGRIELASSTKQPERRDTMEPLSHLLETQEASLSWRTRLYTKEEEYLRPILTKF